MRQLYLLPQDEKAAEIVKKFVNGRLIGLMEDIILEEATLEDALKLDEEIFVDSNMGKELEFPEGTGRETIVFEKDESDGSSSRSQAKKFWGVQCRIMRWVLNYNR